MYFDKRAPSEKARDCKIPANVHVARAKLTPTG